MNFDLSDEQRLLQDSAARYVQERCSFEQWQQWRRDGRQPGLELWPAMAQMGWLSLPFATADGGLDGGAVETMLLSRISRRWSWGAKCSSAAQPGWRGRPG